MLMIALSGAAVGALIALGRRQGRRSVFYGAVGAAAMIFIFTFLKWWHFAHVEWDLNDYKNLFIKHFIALAAHVVLFGIGAAVSTRITYARK